MALGPYASRAGGILGRDLGTSIIGPLKIPIRPRIIDKEGKHLMADAKQFALHASEIRQREQSFSHPWNPKSQLTGVQLSRALRLKRTAVSIARMPG